MIYRGWLAATAVCAAFCAAAGTASANAPAWTTYRHDAARSGIDPDSTSPVTPTQVWQSAALDGTVFGEPLVYGSRVYVATENDTVYALDWTTGAIVWRKHLATPVQASQLCKGDIIPTVGITSTPVIDPTTRRIYVVADTENGTDATTIAHKMYALSLSDGSVAVGPMSVDPPNAPSADTPANQLQRASLALDAGKVIIGYGGNEGDCNYYHGWLVAAREDGTGPPQTYEVDSQGSDFQGAIWASGNAPAIDAAGDIWTSTGNGNSTSFDYQESVTKLDPNLSRLDWWAPSNWLALDQTDKDLGSSMPVLLPSGLVIQVGKDGNGYLLDASHLGQQVGGSTVYTANVCPPTGTTINGSRGGGVYYNGVIYVTCSNGVFALSLDTTNRSFAPLSGWTVPTTAVGPPVEAAGRIWVASYRNGILYGLDPNHGATGAVTFNLGGFEHFEIPGAGGGLLFVANMDPSVSGADQVTAFRIANTSPPTPTAVTMSSSSNPVQAGQPVTYSARVSPPPDAGTIRFTDDGHVISGCSGVSIGSSDRASCTTTSGGGGTHTITAGYSGDAFFTASSSSLRQSVTPTIKQLRVSVVHRRLRLKLTLSEPVRLTVRVFKLIPGRIVHHRCRAGAKHGRRCQSQVQKLTRRRLVGSGVDFLRLRMQALPAARYLVIVTATDSSGLRSKPHSVLVVVSPPRRPRRPATDVSGGATLRALAQRLFIG